MMTTILFFKILTKNFKCAMGLNQIKVNKDICKYEKNSWIFFSNIDEDMRYMRYYRRNTQSSFDLNCCSKFIDPIFWHRIDEHLTLHNIYINRKYKLHEVVYLVNTSLIRDTRDGKKIFKESKFSYIQHVEGVVRSKLCNSSNITGLENIVHKDGQVVFEIPNDCLIINRRYVSYRS